MILFNKYFSLSLSLSLSINATNAFEMRDNALLRTRPPILPSDSRNFSQGRLARRRR